MYSCIKTIVFLFLCYYTVQLATAQPTYSTHSPDYLFQNERIPYDALYDNFIRDLYQDELGFLWIATLDGLFRYDGYEYKKYVADPNDPKSISGDGHTKIIGDARRGFWISSFTSGSVRGGNGIDYYDPKEAIFYNIQLDTLQNTSPFNYVSDMRWNADSTLLWLGTDGGLLTYSPTTKAIQSFPPDNSKTLAVYKVLPNEQATNSFWLGTRKGLWLFEDGKYTAVDLPPLNDNRINDLLFVTQDHLLIACSQGLFEYDIRLDSIYPYTIQLEDSPLYKNADQSSLQGYKRNIKSLCQTGDGELWAGSSLGLYRLNRATKTAKDYSNYLREDSKFVANSAYTLLPTQSGVLWIGKNNGLSKMIPAGEKVRKYELIALDDLAYQERRINVSGTLFSEKCEVKSIVANEADFVWVGTSCGLFQFDKKSKQFLQKHPLLNAFPFLKEKNVTAMLWDREGSFWIGANDYGSVPRLKITNALYRIDTNGQLTVFSSDTEQNPIPRGAIKSMIQDRNGYIWITCPQGLARYDPTLEKMEILSSNSTVNRLSSNNTRVAFEDAEGIIWIGTADGGLSKYDQDTEQFRAIQSVPYQKNRTLSNDRINDIDQLISNELWVGTQLGLNKISLPEQQVTTALVEADDRKIRTILPYDEQTLCVATDHQLLFYSTTDNSSYYLSFDDGFDGGRFIANAGYKDQEGTLYFGGTQCMYEVLPNFNFEKNDSTKLLFTAFQINSQSQNTYILNQQRSPLSFRFNDNNLMFRFAAPLHPDAEILTYRYRLHSTDHWQEIGNSHELRFSNLPPDDYQLEITTDEINSFSRLSLPFTIRAPWYWSWWSKIVYVSVILGIAYLFYRFQLRRRLAEAEATQLKQLDHFKTQFYTNITHEFRTPITVIQGLVSKLNIKKYKTDLAIIKNNSNQLLHLVNQFLSLSKLEAGVMQVNLTQQDVIAFSRYLVESMRSLAEQKEITLRFESDLEELTMDIDADKWQHILVNLLSNAIKFTPEGGEVVITIQRVEQQLLMEVSDTGIGISYKDQMKIFDRFYQVKKEQVLSVGGSGIGLAICKEMVELLDGTIEVESALNKGSVFCIALPIRQEAPLASSVLKSEEQQTHRSLDQELAAINLLAEEEATILLVEDNADVLYYIMKTLRRKYQIITAKDGQEGFSMAKEQLPDLIISDIMMPFMNGYELCYRLKKEETTQHLPVILLTAKADQSSRIEGLKYGADAYLMKPFDEIELILRIEKLLEKQRRMQAYYQSRYLTVPPTPIQFYLGEEYDFIKQCTAIIEASLQAKWNAASLAEKLNVGEHTFRRKIKQLSGFPVTIFVRRLRLKRAHELITTSDDSLKNIAYQVGFGSPNELSNYFKEVFGQSPSELRD